MKIPSTADPAVQQAFRDIDARMRIFDSGLNIPLHGRRVISAGRAVDLDDYVTLRDVRALIENVDTDVDEPTTFTQPSGDLVRSGTHAQRLALSPASVTLQTLFYETDRFAFYQARLSSGVPAWVLNAGSLDPKGDNLASRPADLGANDASYWFFAKDQGYEQRWTGSSWHYTRGLFIGTFANRPTFGDADTNFLFSASDRGYQTWYAGTSAWVLLEGVGGPTRGVIGSITGSLTADDAGYLYYATDFDRVYRWTGSAYEDAPGEPRRGEITYWQDDLLPGTGYALCDGGSYTRSTSTGGTTSWSTPNLTGSNRFIRSVSGTTGGGGGNATTHTHAIDPPNTTSAGPSTATTSGPSTNDTSGPGTTTEVQSGTGVTVASAVHIHTMGNHTHDRSETHDVNIASFTSGAPSGTGGDDALPKYLNLRPYARL